MKHHTYKLLTLVVLGLSMQAGIVHAADMPNPDESVILSNVDGPDVPVQAVKHVTATTPGPGGAAAAGGTAAASDATAADALSPMEHYKELRLQQAAIPNGGNPSAARRYLRVDKATMMESAGQ